jgi:tRNA threonylcarbamoyladenosine biosynthesis protein TsaB
MYTLAVDSSRFLGNIGLLCDDEPLMSLSFNVKATYSEKLLPMIHFLLTQSGLQLEDIGLLAVVRGPGSFTGLRIGMTICKSLSYASGIPIAGVNALEALAAGYAVREGFYLPLFDARKGQVFGALYENNGSGLTEIISPGSFEPRSFFKEVLAKTPAPVFLGEGEAFREIILSHFPSAGGDLGRKAHTDPFAVARLGVKYFNAAGASDLLSLEPDYCRLSDAEINYEKNNPASS